MKKPIGIIAAKILGSTLLLITLIMGGAFLYYSIRSTVSVATRPGTLHELTMEEKLADFNYMYKILVNKVSKIWNS